MSEYTQLVPEVTIGLDLGDRWSHFAILDQGGQLVGEGKVPTNEGRLRLQFEGYRGARIAIEVSTHSPWVQRVLADCGLEVVVANPRQVQLISKNHQKSDLSDPRLLARLARSDPELLRPVTHRGAEVQRDLAVLRSRQELVRSRVALQNHVRCVVKSNGERLKGVTVENFHKNAPAQIPEGLRSALMPLIQAIETLSAKIKELDKTIDKLGEQYPETERLRQVKGVGAITSLAFVLIIEDPARFDTRRSIGPYLGLTPRKSASGNKDPQLGITKRGDEFLRSLLTCAAQYILGPFGVDSDLRRHGERIAQRGGKNAKKRAVIAVARKLAVLLHALWCSGETYEPLRNSKSESESDSRMAM